MCSAQQHSADLHPCKSMQPSLWRTWCELLQLQNVPLPLLVSSFIIYNESCKLWFTIYQQNRCIKCYLLISFSSYWWFLLFLLSLWPYRRWIWCWCQAGSGLEEPTSAPNWDVNRKISSAAACCGTALWEGWETFHDPDDLWRMQGTINFCQKCPLWFFFVVHHAMNSRKNTQPPSPCRHAAIAKLTCFPLRILL